MWGRNQINIREPVQSAFVPNAFRVASARRDERESRESRPGDETIRVPSDTGHMLQVININHIKIKRISVPVCLFLNLKAPTAGEILLHKC